MSVTPRLMALLLLFSAADAGLAQEPATVVQGDPVDVRIALIELRGVGPGGGPLLELRPDDLQVEVEGKAVAIEAIELLSSLAPPPEPGAPLVPLPDLPRPKLVIFLVQADLNGLRLSGHRAFLGSVESLLEVLGPGDQAGVLAFGSSLALELDLTDNRDQIASALRRGARLEPSQGPLDRNGPLARRLDPHAASRVVSPEQALEQIAMALVDRDEEIVVVLLGWGLGRYGSDGVKMNPSWPRAKAALGRIDAPLFIVDITDADFHSLEVALQEGARATGGAYLRAKDFPEGVAKRLANALRTTVQVWVRVPADTPDGAPVSVQLRERAGTLMETPRRLGGG